MDRPSLLWEFNTYSGDSSFQPILIVGDAVRHNDGGVVANSTFAKHLKRVGYLNILDNHLLPGSTVYEQCILSSHKF